MTASHGFGPESASSYFERKLKEIHYLADLAGESVPERAPSDVRGVVGAKMRLRARLLADEILDHPTLTETERRKDREHQVGAFTLRYGYQRYDLRVEGPRVYPALAEPDPPTLYTQSAMAAISAVAFALGRVLPDALVLAYEGTYFETQHLLRDFPTGLETRLVRGPAALAAAAREAASTGRPVVLLICSYVARNWQRIDRAAPDIPADLLLFDTTCYSSRSSRVAALLGWAAGRRLPTVCLRSHLKLDCLGIEYGRLGSAVFTGLPDGSEALDEAEKGAEEGAGDRGEAGRPDGLQQRLLEATVDTMRTFGSFALPSHLPPFRGHPALTELGDIRIGRIMRNTRIAASGLAAALGDSARIGRYHHGLFLTLEPPGNGKGNGSNGPEAAERAADGLARRLVEAGIPAGHTGSFGFDFIAVDGFTDVMSGTDVIRCALADLPDEMIARLVETSAGWWLDHAAGTVR